METDIDDDDDASEPTLSHCCDCCHCDCLVVVDATVMEMMARFQTVDCRWQKDDLERWIVGATTDCCRFDC